MAVLNELREALDTLITAHNHVLTSWKTPHPNGKTKVSSEDYARTEGIITGLEIARGLTIHLPEEDHA